MGWAGPMVTPTELEEVQALLERVLPDPAGFAQRLALQAMTLWGQHAEPRASAFYTATETADAKVGDIVITPDRDDDDDMPVDTNILLAAALGACECWGLRASCDMCWGHGSAGWIQPDPELFDELVQPAIARRSGIPAGEHDQHGSAKPEDGIGERHSAKGENR